MNIVFFGNADFGCNTLTNLIKSKHNLIRHHVGLNIELKYIPQLRFFYDHSLEHAQRIDDLIHKIHKDD